MNLNTALRLLSARRLRRLPTPRFQRLTNPMSPPVRPNLTRELVDDRTCVDLVDTQIGEDARERSIDQMGKSSKRRAAARLPPRSKRSPSA